MLHVVFAFATRCKTNAENDVSRCSYEEPYRADVLDWLYKPNFGAQQGC
jgi:hypothetical protein